MLPPRRTRRVRTSVGICIHDRVSFDANIHSHARSKAVIARKDARSTQLLTVRIPRILRAAMKLIF